VNQQPHAEDGRLAGTKVVDVHGAKVGSVTDVVFDDDTAATPSWVVVGFGPFKSRRTLVPLTDAYRSTEGDLVVAYDRRTVREGPRTGALQPTSRERSQAAHHYGLHGEHYAPYSEN
jgi:sporulation protein YlmC with PRC-barrel domain